MYDFGVSVSLDFFRTILFQLDIIIAFTVNWQSHKPIYIYKITGYGQIQHIKKRRNI